MKGMTHRDVLLDLSARTGDRCGQLGRANERFPMSDDDDKKRDRALQRRVRERQAKTGESYQAAWRQLTDGDPPANEADPRTAPFAEELEFAKRFLLPFNLPWRTTAEACARRRARKMAPSTSNRSPSQGPVQPGAPATGS